MLASVAGVHGCASAAASVATTKIAEAHDDIRAGAAAAIEGARGDIVNERNKTYPDRALAALALL